MTGGFIPTTLYTHTEVPVFRTPLFSSGPGFPFSPGPSGQKSDPCWHWASAPPPVSTLQVQCSAGKVNLHPPNRSAATSFPSSLLPFQRWAGDLAESSKVALTEATGFPHRGSRKNSVEVCTTREFCMAGCRRAEGMGLAGQG